MPHDNIILAFKELIVGLAGGATVSSVLETAKFPADHSITKLSSALRTFFLAATLHPEIVRLAQKELDEVLNGERLPVFSDKPRLPYISAIAKEVMRWRPPSPLGMIKIPHTTSYCVPTGFRCPAPNDGG